MSASIDDPTAAPADRFRLLLEEQRAEAVQQREEALAECATSVPDPVAQRRSADLQRTIEEIDAALARIEDGSYGRCTGCGTAIPEERLELRPFARTCVACTPAA
ncbi:conjugal transfer protein TraR [Blastococcus sp. MG754426]|uniref:TraR/DksA family transcriptional regulator n=1 Tax=unclassified Blastococcus TaxID=2619396 RepID=UPI001EEFC2A2|nr:MULTISPECIES: TraR/DksA C4-type zinc finger protein [unclassified Blastococcus]MCF6507656.1 conjugal transfer protein TraR [Blastococcus sp. MG754426]MCF6512702.1 conjugal transfer protein TraR [Blastococcus sp. MG754427]MCF6735834.1 conjugal transfer protein TraR [Blastococcus sp. KM273129]